MSAKELLSVMLGGLVLYILARLMIGQLVVGTTASDILLKNSYIVFAVLPVVYILKRFLGGGGQGRS